MDARHRRRKVPYPRVENGRVSGNDETGQMFDSVADLVSL